MDPLSVESTAHSMPSPEEVRTESAINNHGKNPHSGKNKRKAALIAICVMALALIIGFSAAIANKNRAARNAKDKYTWDPSAAAEPEDESLTNVRKESRLDDVMTFLSQTITLADLFNDKNSPQYKAAKWIADQDFMEVAIPADPENYDDDFEFVQRYIMAVFYFALDGANWRYKAYFMSDFSVCEWNIDFFEEIPGQEDDDWMYGVQCDENGAISTIFMTSNRLQGEFPAELGDLLDLDHISLYDNLITGNFPERMQYLTDLNFVALESNRMKGKLPAWINKWSELQFLALGDNEFTGPIPNLVGLDYLVELALDSNQFTGSIDPFNDLEFIESIFLNDNKFDGWFGEVTWEALEYLVTVDLSDNSLTGFVPEWIYYLETVDLHDNFLNTTMAGVRAPDDSPLRFLSVYGNDITGPIPDTLGDLPELTHLDLSDNYFTGIIPEKFYYLSNLEVLYLTDNELDVQPFPDLEDSPFMRELGLGDSQLTGPIPNWVGEVMRDLEVLDLRDNALTGTIPENLSELEMISYLLINYNQLTGAIPDFSYCEWLALLYIDNNSFGQDTLVGSLESVCEQESPNLYSIIANCNIDCSCCSTCCKAEDTSCNDWDETLRLSDAAERQQVLFMEDKIFDNVVDVSE